jgi:hypothetical protein
MTATTCRVLTSQARRAAIAPRAPRWQPALLVGRLNYCSTACRQDGKGQTPGGPVSTMCQTDYTAGSCIFLPPAAAAGCRPTAKFARISGVKAGRSEGI